MEKEFIPYEQALALKELGFNEPCCAFGNPTIKNDFIAGRINEPIKNDGWFIAIPLYQQVFRFFRDKYGLSSNVILKMKSGKKIGFFIINELDNRLIKSKFFNSYTGTIYNSYEEAELACLNKLIEIVKNIK